MKDVIKDCKKSPIYEWSIGKKQLNNSPWLCYISVTNLCNNRCKVCPRQYTMRDDRGVMDFDTFKNIVDKLPKTIKKVYLFKQGEPFINKNLGKFAKYLREKLPDVFISIHTNGVVSTKERVKEVLPYIDSLGVSISATNQADYKEIHGVDNFGLVIKNLKDISDINLSLNKEKHIFIDYVYQQDNAKVSEEKVLEFFKKYKGLNSIDIHNVFNFQGEIEEGNMEIYDKLEEEKFPTCVFPWSAIIFLHDAKLSYCFVEPKENVFLGDITNHTFEEVWNGEDYQLFRKRMYNHKFAELSECNFGCKKCTWLWNMKSQSPKNLSVGFTLNKKFGINNFDIGDYLETSPETIIEKAADLFQMGEIHMAVGYLSLINKFYDKPYRKVAEELLSLCDTVLQRYKNISIWKKTLAEEGYEPEEKRTKYYEI